MERLDELLLSLQALLLNPMIDRLIGIFDLNGRFSVVFLGISYLTALLLYRLRLQDGTTTATGYWRFIGGREVFWHPSARLDYQYYLVRGVLKLLFVLPVMGLVDPYIWESRDYVGFFEQVWGERPRLGENMGLMMLYGLGLFLIADCVHYWVHRAFHCRWLWEFHKVHHSAEVMVPATASRIHVVEKVAEKVAKGVFIGAYAGGFYYLCGGSVSKYTLFGSSYLVLLFNSLAANLRHTHIWLSFGPLVEHLINSPAQHQIHHSNDPKHFNRNFGTNLSLWDWMFGTLYVTGWQPEPLTFGAGKPENNRYRSLWALIFLPFILTFSRLRVRLRLRLAGRQPPLNPAG
ncbi:sterol desaturase family protein [Oceanisphaera sp. KMM 10153]|uniref:sterol desaturase family protein n=1 Tax=Oceanisphaera submarina TaxID=3390193 RepID=UPI0039763C39